MRDDPEKGASGDVKPNLAYAQPIAWRNRSSTRRALHFVIIVVAMIIAVRLLTPVVKHIGFLYRQRAIWTYSAPASQITYSDIPSDFKRFHKRTDYHEMHWTWDIAQFGSPQPTLPFRAIVHVPPLLREMLYGAVEGCAYLHAGKTVRGLPLIAGVVMEMDVLKGARRHLRLLGLAIQPAEYSPYSRPFVVGQSGVDLFLEPSDRLRIFAGMPDPADPTRFSISYLLNGQTGTIDGLIDNQYWVTLKVRDGPALAKAEQWSLYHDATGR